MPQDVFPETNLNVSMALQISDCFAVIGSDVTMPLCQPRDWKAKAPERGIPFHKTTRVPICPAFRNQTDTNFSYVSKNTDSNVFHFPLPPQQGIEIKKQQ